MSDARDVREMRTADLDADGRHEIAVRLAQRLSLPGDISGSVARELLVVYAVTEDGVRRCGAVEVAIARADASVRAEVRWPRARGGPLEVRAGPVTGWDARSWPFSERNIRDEVHPIPLPWREPALLRLTVRDGRLVHAR
ncbi:MAG: hypothetical protein NZ898_01280 [Myxococcota bacterium]|nr:hypothetical protein [Myxococcota bacterium]MDW8360773.1 hypothetical protein [Myxococcales bacterium]